MDCYSTMSASLNTVAGTLYEDFVQYVLKGKKQTDQQQNIALKLITLVVGIISVLMVFVVERLGTIVQVYDYNTKHQLLSKSWNFQNIN